MIEQSGSGGWGTTPIGHWTMKRTAAAVGIVVHLGMGMGPAWAQNATTSPASNGGTSLPGVPVTPVSRVADSVGGVTQATSANKAMSCSAGTVLSGGSCITLPSPTPPPNCAYGTVWTGGSCVAIGSLTPPPTNCPSGQVLSGSACVPLPTVPSTCPTAQPVTTQYLNCPSGQTGSIVQTRTVQCDASTSWQWTTSTWNTSSNTCATVPTPPPPAQPCPAIYQTWGTACYGYSPSASPGSQFTVTSASSTYPGSATYQCNNGSWTYVSGSCSGGQPATPPPCNSQTVSWSSCSGYVSSTSQGGYAYPSNTTSGATGSATFQCNSGNWTYVNGSCNATPPPPPPPPPPQPQCQAYYGMAWTWGTSNQCSGTVNVGPTPSGSSYTVYGQAAGSYYRFSCSSGTWQPGGDYCPNAAPPPASGCAARSFQLADPYNYGYVCTFPLPSGSSGQVVYGGSVGTANSAMGGTAVCSNGSWNTNGLTCMWNGGGY